LNSSGPSEKKNSGLYLKAKLTNVDSKKCVSLDLKMTTPVLCY